METKPAKKHTIPSGENLKIAILLPYFNEKIGLELYQNTLDTLLSRKVKGKNIRLVRVAGALELPFAAQKVIKKLKPDSVIALGVIIKGETSHYTQVCNETFRGLMNIQLKLETPIVFGILTCETEFQAKRRASKTGLNKGKSYAETALIQANI